MDASVVIPAFDRPIQLREALEHLNNQTYPLSKFEVIVVDDSGEERLVEKAVVGFSPSFRLLLFRTGLPYEVNGVSVARNIGIRHADGSLIIFIDDDCLPHPHFIEQHIQSHRGKEKLIVLGHRSPYREQLNEPLPISIKGKKAKDEFRRSRLGLLTFQDFMTGNVSVKKNDLLDVGLFDESFAQPDEHGWEDVELGYRLMQNELRIEFNPNALIYRPPTEPHKERHRRKVGAYEKARRRLLSLHPELEDLLGMSIWSRLRRRISQIHTILYIASRSWKVDDVC